MDVGPGRFIIIVLGVMYVLYGGIATPSEAADVGAALCLILAILIYRLWQPEQIWLILRDTMREFGNDSDYHCRCRAVRLHADFATIILMTSPMLLPIITAGGFDPVWFGMILTINTEIDRIHPQVGLNIYIVNAIAPDVPVTKVMWGTLRYVICMMLAIVILCILPQIATWLPEHLMGVGK